MSDLPQELHFQVFDCDGRVHFLFFLQHQHEQPPHHVTQQVTGTIGIHLAIAGQCTLLKFSSVKNISTYKSVILVGHLRFHAERLH